MFKATQGDMLMLLCDTMFHFKYFQSFICSFNKKRISRVAIRLLYKLRQYYKIHRIEYNSTMRKKELLSFATIRIDRKSIVLSEISQISDIRQMDLLYILNLKNVKCIKIYQNDGCRKLGDEENEKLLLKFIKLFLSPKPTKNKVNNEVNVTLNLSFKMCESTRI